MYWHRESGLVYLAHPRTASISTRTALIEQAGFQAVGGHHAGWLRNKAVPIVSGITLEHWDGRVTSAATTVRYHLDALVSWWFHKGRTGPLDREFVAHLAGGSWFPIRDEWWGLHRHTADTVLRYENLDEDLNRWLAEHGLDPVRVPQPLSPRRARDPAHYRSFVDRETARYIDERYGKEMDVMRYPRAVEAVA
jgi:hypothetical protein